jgi:hypothetical protein
VGLRPQGSRRRTPLRYLNPGITRPRRAVQDGELELIQDAGHRPEWDQPEAVAQTIAAALSTPGVMTLDGTTSSARGAAARLVAGLGDGALHALRRGGLVMVGDERKQGGTSRAG